MASSIQTIPDISVSGINLPVHNLSWEVGVDKSPSSISIDFVSEDGNYEAPELSVLTPVTITIGDDYVFNYFPIACTISKSTSGGKLMNVKFVDKSLILDKIFVGLKNQHGLHTELPILIVGTEKDPCEDIETGDLDDDNEIADPCNPCTVDGKPLGESELQERIIDCLKARKFNILEAEYTFNDLLKAVRDETPVELGETLPPSNDDYKAQYIGSLRSVLQSWGSDYGFTFYWDEDDILQFVDLRAGFDINDEDIRTASCGEKNVISTVENHTLEGTLGKGVVSFFRKEGALRDYDCESEWCKKITMRPMTFSSIIPASSPGHYESYTELQKMCVLTYYSPLLRDNYIWFNKMVITDAHAAVEMLEGKSGAELKELQALGFESVKKVYLPYGDIRDRNISQKIAQEVFSTPEKTEDFYKRGGYFFVAKKNEDKHTQKLELEGGLASDFLGKFFVRKFTQNIRGLDYSYLTPDGDSLTYYRRADPVQFPFVNLVKDNFKIFQTYLNELVDSTTEQASDHFLILERNPHWSPLPKASFELESILSNMEKEHFEELGNVSLEDSSVTWEDGDSLFVGYESKSGLEVTDRDEAVHPLEEENVHLAVEACNLGTTYGLRASNALSYNVKSEGMDATLWLPVMSHVETATDHAGYMVLWDRNGSNRVFIDQDKIELTEKKVPLMDENIMSIEINNKDVTRDVVNLFSDDINTLCEPKELIIRERMKKIMESMDFTITSPLEKRSYTLAGLPLRRYTISDGIESISIRFSGSGLETNLSFGTVQKQAISPNVFIQHFEAMNRRGTNTWAKLKVDETPDSFEEL